MSTDLAWFAGLFEGEGTLTISRSGRRGYTRPIVTLAMTDKQCVDLFHERWPGCLQVRPMGVGQRTAYVWTLNQRAAILTFVGDLQPYFRTERVQQKARLLIEDVLARKQGARQHDYLAQCHERREAMALLNKRGT